MPETPPIYTQRWGKVALELLERLRKGHNEYGDASFTKPATTTLQELKEEALDIMGWGFILVCKLDDMAATLTNQTETVESLREVIAEHERYNERLRRENARLQGGDARVNGEAG